MKKPVYIVGHKNPDADAIISAIALAEYKNKTGTYALPVRLGTANSETEYLLNKFGYEEPEKMYTSRSTLKEITIDKANIISKDTTMKEALDLCLKTNNRSLFVAKNKELEGIVTLDDLTYMWTKSDEDIKKIIKNIRIKNIEKILNAKVVSLGSEIFSGELHIFPSLKSKVKDDSIVLLRNEDDKIKYCIEKKARLIIIVTSSPVKNDLISLAKEKDVSILTTDLSPLTVTRLIYQMPDVSNVMIDKKKIIYFNENDTVEETSKVIIKSRHRSYPVVSDEGKIVGAVSRYHLFNYEKKKFILVDHNEYKQSIEDIEDDQILEIIDHHRLGGFETDTPISITTMPVGATSTIIAKMFIDNHIEMDSNLAGLLLGGIISDTMNFKSPTTTSIDEEISKILEKKANINISLLSKEMIEHADSLLSKKFIEIVFSDFKEFNIEGNKIGLAQSPCKSKDEFLALKKDLSLYLEDSCKTGGYQLLIIMLTNLNGTGSYVLGAGDKKYIFNDIFVNRDKDCFVKGLVSRKKQLLPDVIKALEK